MFKVLEL